MSAPARYDFSLQQACYVGANLTRVFEAQEAGEPINLAAYTPYMQVRSAPGADVILEGSDYLEVTDPDNGEITLNVPADITAALTPGRYVYDLFIVSDDLTIALLGGYFDVTDRVTVVE